MHLHAAGTCVLLLSALAVGCVFSTAAPAAKGTHAERWDALGSPYARQTPAASQRPAPEPEAEPEEVARLSSQAGTAENDTIPGEAWHEGIPHPTAPHVESASAPDTWRPIPGYKFRDQTELTVRWVPGLKHRDDSTLVAGEVEGEWVPVRPGSRPTANSDGAASDLAKGRDRAKERLFFPFAQALSCPWFSGGRVFRPAPNPMESAKRVLALKTGGLRELEDAQEGYVDVVYFEQRAWDLQGAVSATPREIEMFAESFVAALLDDQETLNGNLVEAILDVRNRTRRIERDMLDGHVAACRATRDLGALWRKHLLALVQDLAGQQALRRPPKWAIVLAPNPFEGGLAVVNDTGKQLHDVTIAVHSELAGSKAGFEDYYVHLPTFARGQRLVLSIEMVLAVFEQQPRSQFEGTVTYSLWAREGRIEDVTLHLPRKEYELFRTNAKIPKELVLGSDE